MKFIKKIIQKVKKWFGRNKQIMIKQEVIVEVKPNLTKEEADVLAEEAMQQIFGDLAAQIAKNMKKKDTPTIKDTDDNTDINGSAPLI